MAEHIRGGHGNVPVPAHKRLLGFSLPSLNPAKAPGVPEPGDCHQPRVLSENLPFLHQKSITGLGSSQARGRAQPEVVLKAQGSWAELCCASLQFPGVNPNSLHEGQVSINCHCRGSRSVCTDFTVGNPHGRAPPDWDGYFCPGAWLSLGFWF